MIYIVIELQQLSNSQVANIVTAFVNKDEAERKYHTILAAAAVSTLQCHSAVMLDEKGNLLKHEYYTHEVVSNE